MVVVRVCARPDEGRLVRSSKVVNAAAFSAPLGARDDGREGGDKGRHEPRAVQQSREKEGCDPGEGSNEWWEMRR